ncbi:MAG: PhoU domain-containing protein [Nannocystaceae bacterium]|nr:phosphotransferase [Myxococcales bacterium]
MPIDDERSAISAIRENFHFLALEVRKQLEDTRAVMRGRDPKAVRSIAARDDYVDNLRSVIENKSFALLGRERVPKRTVDLVRAINTSTSNLERIADYCVNIAGQLGYLQSGEVVSRYDAEPFFAELIPALGAVEDALFSRDLSRGLAICRAEARVDELYAAVFGEIMQALRTGEAPEDLVTALFIYRYLERAGDSLLNIGEAIILAAVGEKLKVSEFQALQETLAISEVDLDVAELDYEGIWETRSGSRITAVHGNDPSKSDTRWVIFKEGRTRKVIEEKEALERWEQLEPGLPPKIYGFHDHGDKASLLLEYLPGDTFQSIVFEGSPAARREAFALATAEIAGIWERTLERVPSAPQFVHQLRKRLPDVLKVHPEVARAHARIGGFAIHSFEELLDRVEPLDDVLVAPFCVLIHGDFNTDNIIINRAAGRVHFIDLHRSKQFDYLQDVSVFLVSNFRMPVFEDRGRARLNEVNLQFYRFARAFAQDHEDHLFMPRLALGLARSLVTSVRFQLDDKFAGAMFMRAIYLLERLLEHQRAGADWASFSLRDGVFTYW